LTVEWSRDQELALTKHYGRSAYWAGGPWLESDI